MHVIVNKPIKLFNPECIVHHLQTFISGILKLITVPALITWLVSVYESVDFVEVWGRLGTTKACD